MGWLWHATGLLFTVVVGPNSALEPAEAVLTETDITASTRRSSALCNGGGGRGLWWVLVGAGIREGILQRRGAYMAATWHALIGLRFYDSKIRILCHQSAEIGAG